MNTRDKKIQVYKMEITATHIDTSNYALDNIMHVNKGLNIDTLMHVTLVWEGNSSY